MNAGPVIAIIACLALSGCGAPPQITLPPPEGFAQDPIPAAFRHTWAAEDTDCLTRDGQTRMMIDPATVSFSLGRFDVTSLREISRTEIEINVRAVGGPPQRHLLQLADKAETLVYQGPDNTFTFHRCHARGEPGPSLAVLGG